MLQDTILHLSPPLTLAIPYLTLLVWVIPKPGRFVSVTCFLFAQAIFWYSVHVVCSFVVNLMVLCMFFWAFISHNILAVTRTASYLLAVFLSNSFMLPVRYMLSFPMPPMLTSDRTWPAPVFPLLFCSPRFFLFFVPTCCNHCQVQNI
ncbi:unnamed protein product [Choristocarpus tenellus]